MQNSMPSFLQLFAPTLSGLLGFIFGGYLLSRIWKRNDIADFLWGLGFIALALIHVFCADSLGFRAWLAFAFTLAWGVRLSTYLGFRIFGKKHEDIRYAEWRKSWGKKEPWKAFLKVFLLQGSALGIIALPIIFAIRMPDTPITLWDFLGTILFLFGFIFESIADAQLAQFKKNPENRGKVMARGLWSLSRHPNYFGEVLIWWGLFFISFSLPNSFWAILSPLLITYLLTRVSGVPMLDKILAAKGAGFQDYINATPAFWPFDSKGPSRFIAILASLAVMDFLWLGVAVGSFYRAESQQVARMIGGEWDVLLWPALGVYFFLALGIQVFAVVPDKIESIYRGALFGLCAYGIYDLTNLALVKDWPWRMSLLDLIWGPVLCSIGAAVGAAVCAKRQRIAPL